MLVFAVYMLLFIFGSIGLFKFTLYATSEDGFLSVWQKVLDWMWARNRNAAKLLGACGMCFAHSFSIVSFILFVIFAWDMWTWGWFQSFMIYCVYVGMAWWGMFRQLPKPEEK